MVGCAVVTGNHSLILDGDAPAKVPDAVIDEIKRRETGGLITLTQQGIRRGDRVRILRGPFKDHLAIYSDSRSRDRVEVLLQLLGGAQRATLESLDVKLVD
jgi:transcription antitermination factor NusG